jgi:RND superfamily putative drug exporter
VLGVVLRRPAVSAVAAAALLLVLASPALDMRTATAGTDDLPRDLPVMQAYDRMQAAFPGGQMPGVVVVRGDVTAPPARAAFRDLERRAAASPHLGGPVDVAVSPDRTVAVLSVPMAGTGSYAASEAALRELRGEVVPATVGRLAGAGVAVTGMVAGSKDFNDLMAARMPLVVGFVLVLALAFALLLVTFRSLVVPIKAIVLNLLSVAASYGVVVWVFQDGNGEGLLGFQSGGFVVSWLPMFLFVILFGLSMDYHVFIVSRIRAAWQGGMSTKDAVRHGISATAGTVTSAAVVMVAVFGVFGTLSSVEFKMMGVGLATAILIDATIVRAVLLPATMALLGDANWWMPRALRRLPLLAPEPPAPAPAGG